VSEYEATGIITIGPKKCPHCHESVWIQTVGTETEMENLGAFNLSKTERPAPKES
jgi:hypothetical protein